MRALAGCAPSLAGRALPLALALAFGAAGCTRDDVRNAGNAVASAAPVVAGDAIIIAQVETRFVQIDADSALHVAVASRDGNVTLHGRVKNRATSQRFVGAARRVPGVKAVAASLTLDAALPSTRASVSDFVLAAAVRANVTAQAGINGAGLGITASGGVVTLRGRVKTAALRATLLDTARRTRGVTSVVDALEVGA